MVDAEQVTDWAAYMRAVRGRAAASVKPVPVAPPPEVTSRGPWPAEIAIPAVAARLAKVAENVGWVVRVQYSRAAVVCRRGGALVLERRHFVGVVLRHESRDLRAAVVWEAPADADKLSWKVGMCMLGEAGQLPVGIGITALKELL